MQPSLEDKKRKLVSLLRGFDRLAVALSGGVDSALLLAEAHDVLGTRLMAVSVRTPVHPEQDITDAVRIAKTYGICHAIVDLDVLQLDAFVSNTPERCYVCKKSMLAQLQQELRKKGAFELVHGANADDLGDYRRI